MSKPLVTIHNTETGEIVEREMTDAEFVQYQADQAAQAIKATELATKAAARQAVLDRLGLTEDEARLLLG